MTITTDAVDYTLRLNESELNRYRGMAERACEAEEAAWALAGIVPGARVADVGCGPGLVLAELARVVGPNGTVIGVDQAAEARDAARALLDNEGITNATVREGTADATGLAAGTFDVVMQRHVLLHNGGREAQIVAHLASLLQPGGAVYLVETDLDMVRLHGWPEGLVDLRDAWRELMRRLGNDGTTGSRLVSIAAAAGLEVCDVDARFDVIEGGAGTRPPAWSARDAIVAAGLATEDDVARWGRLLDEADEHALATVSFVPLFRVVARRSARPA